MTQTRKVFIYLAISAVVLGFIGVLIMLKNPPAKVVSYGENRYNQKEISKHITERSCWISMEGKVYDITLLLQIYYDKTLKKKCGGDVESDFFSANMKKILQQYQIGVLK
jgi:cytochrome b involved in lipid metabolism